MQITTQGALIVFEAREYGSFQGREPGVSYSATFNVQNSLYKFKTTRAIYERVAQIAPYSNCNITLEIKQSNDKKQSSIHLLDCKPE